MDRLLSDISKEFAAATNNLGVLLDLAASRLSETIGDLAVIRLLSADGKYFETRASVHHPDPAIVNAARTAFLHVAQGAHEGISGQVVGTRRSLFLPVYGQDEAARLTLPGWVAFLRQICRSSPRTACWGW